MIRILTDRIIEGNKRYIEAAALSTDSKPTADIVTGSVLVTVDDGKGYLFNETAGEWVEQ
jgi:hypothetical protein